MSIKPAENVNAASLETFSASSREYVYPYPRPMVTVDAVIFDLAGPAERILLIQRRNPPFAGQWALPGGFVDMEESLEAAAARELAEETGLHGVHLEQLRAFGNPGRDPRGRNICIAFAGVCMESIQAPQAADDAGDAQWVSLEALPVLAFDHGDIVEYAVQWLRSKQADNCFPCTTKARGKEKR